MAVVNPLWMEVSMGKKSSVSGGYSSVTFDYQRVDLLYWNNCAAKMELHQEINRPFLCTTGMRFYLYQPDITHWIQPTKREHNPNILKFNIPEGVRQPKMKHTAVRSLPHWWNQSGTVLGRFIRVVLQVRLDSFEHFVFWSLWHKLSMTLHFFFGWWYKLSVRQF